MYAQIFKDSAASVKAWNSRSRGHAKLAGLGILRKDMPQIKSADMPEFVTFAKENGVSITKEQKKVGTLKPSQSEYNAKQASQIPVDSLRKPLTVSNDGYVLDGHNRWARMVKENPGQSIDVNKINLPAVGALKLMHSFPKSFHKNVADVGATKKVELQLAAIFKDSAASTKAWLSRDRLNKGTLPPEPGTVPIPEGHVRLYHQTTEDNIASIVKNGMTIDHAKGIEGPKAVYASTTGFYGKPGSRPTIEFHVPKDKWQDPFVLQDVKPKDMIAAHLPWHSKARYILDNPDVLKAVLAGEHDTLTGDYAPAVAYVKAKYGAKNVPPAKVLKNDRAFKQDHLARTRIHSVGAY